jgi:hypothetical protein
MTIKPPQLGTRIAELIDTYGVSSVLEEVINKLRSDATALRDEYAQDCQFRDVTADDLQLIIPQARRIQN